MDREKIVTTRELLRDFKVIRELLISRKVDSVIIPGKGSTPELEIKVKPRPRTGAAILEGLKALGPVKVERNPHLFDDLLKYRDRINL